MWMWMLIGELMRVRTREHLASSPLHPEEMPGLRRPATPAQVERLQVLAGQPLDPSYRHFLSLTDGLDGFPYTMPLLGCRDWDDPERSGPASRFRDITVEAGPPTEVGLPEGTRVFSIHGDVDGSAGILMLRHGDEALERFWWSGEGDDMFFHTFRDLVACVADGSCSPRHLFG
ncbi:SMI1/KNR4 family protein [Streptomyces sp. NPDC003522]